MAKIGLSETIGDKIKYKKHPTDPNIILKYEVKESEILKDRVEEEIANTELMKKDFEDKLAKLADLPEDGKDLDYEGNLKNEIERLDGDIKQKKDLKAELEEDKLWQ